MVSQLAYKYFCRIKQIQVILSSLIPQWIVAYDSNTRALTFILKIIVIGIHFFFNTLYTGIIADRLLTGKAGLA
jgi:hypothetical protein